jgi:peptidyl-prolyl cis-trans isomerase C
MLAGAGGVILTAGMLLAQSPGAEPKAAESKVAAVVNGETITLADVETVLQMRGPLPVELPAAKRRQLQYEALGLLMDNVLMEQFLRKSGPRIDEAEVNKRLTELEQSIKKAGKTLTDYYKESKQTETQVRQALLQMLQWETYARARLNDVDIKRYYDENKDFFDGVTVRASHILLRIARTSADAERQANRQKLLAIRQEIISGQVDFAAAAKKYSQCPSAAEGGDIGSFPRKMVVDESFAKAAFALAVGQVSDVVATDFGLHLIKVTERKAGDKPSEFEKIKDVVRDFCIEELRQVILAQQRTAAKIEVFLRQS